MNQGTKGQRWTYLHGGIDGVADESIVGLPGAEPDRRDLRAGVEDEVGGHTPYRALRTNTLVPCAVLPASKGWSRNICGLDTPTVADGMQSRRTRPGAVIGRAPQPALHCRWWRRCGSDKCGAVVLTRRWSFGRHSAGGWNVNRDFAKDRTAAFLHETSRVGSCRSSSQWICGPHEASFKVHHVYGPTQMWV